MNIIKHTRTFILLAAVGLTCFALADDDDDGHESHGEREPSKRNIATVSDPTYRAECSSCHMLYPPGLLPARSWIGIMGGLKDHFGENAFLDKTTNERVTLFLTKNAADQSPMKRSQKIAQSIGTTSTPIRFTETPYFKRQHHEIGAKVWQRKSVGSQANCAACHPRAEAGIFSEDEIHIPR
jgi:hypothetical protein